MRREFKFRTFDVIRKRMIYTDIFDFSEFTGIMQYIGLLDRNGKEIYEEDFIKCFDDYHKDKIYKVYYDEAGFLPFADADDGVPYPDPNKCEVIGNSYENPELK